MSRLTLSFLIFISSIWSANAADETVEMADLMRQDGKIYVVVGCILLIFIGLVLFLLRLEKRISKLEKSESHEN